LLLRANDYPPSYRKALAAIAHRIPGIRFLRQLRSTDVFNQDDVVDLLLRQGYSPGDAKILSEAVERADRDSRRRSIEQQARGQLAKYWELGVLSKDDYISMLVTHGLDPRDAATAANLAELDLKSKRLQKIVAYVKRQFTKGATNAQGAATMLRNVGLQEERVTTYLEDWALEVEAKHKEISAGTAVKWACDGLIPLAELSARLSNLGYRPQDVAGLLSEAELCSATRAARAAARAAQAERQRISQLKQQQREAAQAIQAARRQLASHGSPSQLRKWYCSGHIGQTELYSRLQFLGWPTIDIERLISDCKNGKPKPTKPA